MNEKAMIVRAVVESLEAGLFMTIFALAVDGVVEQGVTVCDYCRQEPLNRHTFLPRTLLITALITLVIAVDSVYRACI